MGHNALYGEEQTEWIFGLKEDSLKLLKAKYGLPCTEKGLYFPPELEHYFHDYGISLDEYKDEEAYRDLMPVVYEVG